MRILAVDNDPIVHETLVQLVLQDVRFDAVAAQTADAALTLLKDRATHAFDCVLLSADIIGVAQVMDSLQGRKRHAKTPIMIMADFHDSEVLDAAILPQVTDYLAKPFNLDTLVDRLKGLRVAPKVAAPKPAPSIDAPVPIGAKLRIFDANGFIKSNALENYAKQLPRATLYGAGAFGLAIRDINGLHTYLSPFDFHALVNDVASVIAEEMQIADCLMAYTGDGVFVGIAESNWRNQPTDLMRRVNARLEEVPLRDSAEQPLQIGLSAGQSLRLTWKSPSGVVAAIAQAREGAVEARATYSKLREEFWFLERSA